VRFGDPTGHCIPGIGDCQFTGQINWHDGAEFVTGLVEGGAGALAAVVTAPIALVQAAADPMAAVQGVQEQAATVSRGAAFLANDPAGAAAVLNENPRAVGQVLGEAVVTAGAAKLASASRASGNTQLFRAVDAAEFDDLQKVKMFRTGGGAEGKYFAESPNHAGKWGQLMLGEGKYKVVGAKAPLDVPHTRWEKLDGIGPARFYEAEHLPRITYTGEVRR
jgi:hypothetical protein